MKNDKKPIPEISSERLADARRLREIYNKRIKGVKTQAQFGLESGIGSQGMVNQYLSGKRPLNISAATKFADALRCRIANFSPSIADEIMKASPLSALDDIIRDDFNVSTFKISNKKQVPLISWVKAGQFSDVENYYEPGDGSDWITPSHTNPSKNSFALRVEGDSMSGNPSGVNFPEGCVIIVDPNRAPKAGDYVVAKDVVNQKATFKKLTTDGSTWYLKPLNPAYPTKEIDDPALRVIGVVIELQMSVKL